MFEDTKSDGLANLAVGVKVILRKVFPVHGARNSVVHVRWGKPGGSAVTSNI